MDLGAYAQIDNLGSIAKKNNIIVPRLRGYRLMKYEEPVDDEFIEKSAKHNGLYECESIICSISFGWTEYSSNTERLVNKYMIKEKRTSGSGIEYYDIVDVNWDAVHGDLRKRLKFATKKARNEARKQYNTFNKYVGRDVLYIHARIGGGNWNYYGGPELEKQPWFLEKVDDAYDNTYCDIYAKIEPISEDQKGAE